MTKTQGTANCTRVYLEVGGIKASMKRVIEEIENADTNTYLEAEGLKASMERVIKEIENADVSTLLTLMGLARDVVE